MKYKALLIKELLQWYYNNGVVNFDGSIEILFWKDIAEKYEIINKHKILGNNYTKEILNQKKELLQPRL